MSTKYVFNPFTGKLDVTDDISSTAITSLTGDVTATGPGAAAATIANDAVTFAKMQNIATDTLIGRDTAGTGDPESISVTGGLEFTGSQSIQRSALTGDVTATAGSNATTIANNAVTNAKLADMATQTFKGRTTAGTGDPEDLTATQATAMLNTFVGDTGAGGTKGLVPAPAAGDATKFLKGDGTWGTVTATAPNSVVHLDTGNGLATTDTVIRRFSNVQENVGSDITYADNAANGARFTINTAGIYTIEYSDVVNAGTYFGVSLNSSALTTNLETLTYAQGKRSSGMADSATIGGFSSCTLKLSVNDVIRPHTGGSVVTGNTNTIFRITRIA